MLRNRGGDRVEDLLWWEGHRVLGFLGLYGFGSALELAGMVAPDARGRGIGGALLDAAMSLCHQRGSARPLLIVPRSSASGRSLALRRGGVLDHSEHALVLTGEVNGGADDPTIGLRPATATDLPLLSRLLEEGFGQPPPDELLIRLDSPGERTMIVVQDDSAVGTMRLTRDGNEAGVYGFVIEPSRQGRGIGRAALRRACQELRADGVRKIHLEVAVENDRALGLYTSVGFTLVATEDYFALSVD